MTARGRWFGQGQKLPMKAHSLVCVDQILSVTCILSESNLLLQMVETLT